MTAQQHGRMLTGDGRRRASGAIESVEMRVRKGFMCCSAGLQQVVSSVTVKG